MNFLMMRSNSQTSLQEKQPVQVIQHEVNHELRPSTEGLISEDSFSEFTSFETRNAENHDYEVENCTASGSSGDRTSRANSCTDVTEANGLIIIPSKEVPGNWMEAADMLSFLSLDRNFVFPGEQIHILVCLSAHKQDTEIITPFKDAAVMNKNAIGRSNMKQDVDIGGEDNLVSQTMDANVGEQDKPNGESEVKVIGLDKDVPTGESLRRVADYRRRTEQLLQRFKGSHFFARIAASDKPLWTIRGVQEASSVSSQTYENKSNKDLLETEKFLKKKHPINVAIDQGKFDACASGGVVRGSSKFCSLSNGDIVVLLQVNISVEFVRDPILEILQFEKHQVRNSSPGDHHIRTSEKLDPSGDLLKWLLPLDNSIPPPYRALSPPTLSSSSSIGSTSTKPTQSGSSGSHLFSFGNFRSHSMSSLPKNSTPPPGVTGPYSKPSVDPEAWNQFSFRKFVESENSRNEGLLSFRGVPMEPERFSVRCGLEGNFTPGRRWRKKIEMIQPVEVSSFAVDCNTDDLLCVHIKNVCPVLAADIVVFIDTISVIFEEASSDGTLLSLPIACTEAGDDYKLPNLELRRGEEHSFILKPQISLWKCPVGRSVSNLRPAHLPAGSAASIKLKPSNAEAKHGGSPPDRYAILVSCRCNYSESKLFFKQPTSWRPHVSRELMISVASESGMSRKTLSSDGTQLPVQVLTLQASNLTSENLNLTVLAPASFTSPSVASLSSSPSSPFSTYTASSELMERASTTKQGAAVQHVSSVPLNEEQKDEDGLQSVSFNECHTSTSDVVPSSDLGCTHLWLQSRVPLGCIPPQSMATVKLEVLPLTDGIITLDSLQIDVKEKGVVYAPEHALKINAMSSTSTGVS